MKESDESEDINYRNGHSFKFVRSNYGEVSIDIPRDRSS